MHCIKITWTFLVVAFTLFVVVGCDKSIETKTLEVTATAFNSLPSQTNKKHPTKTAWGDKLEVGMKCIAVSRDLIALGLKHNTEVEIEGFPGTYLVLDKMHTRWTKRIDIYMDNDREAAIQFGKKKVTISWQVPVISKKNKKRDSIN